MSFSLLEGKTEAEKRVIIAAAVKYDESNRGFEHMYPHTISVTEDRAIQEAKKQHAPGVTCSIDPVSFRPVYKDANGKVVSVGR